MNFKKRKKYYVLEYSTNSADELVASRPVLSLNKKQLDEQRKAKRKRVEFKATKNKGRNDNR